MGWREVPASTGADPGTDAGADSGTHAVADPGTDTGTDAVASPGADAGADESGRTPYDVAAGLGWPQVAPAESTPTPVGYPQRSDGAVAHVVQPPEPATQRADASDDGAPDGVSRETPASTAPASSDTPAAPSAAPAAPTAEPGPDAARVVGTVEDEPTPIFDRPDATRVLVVANQKGGVGKTTTAVNLAAGLGAGGLKVLVVDLDPQGNASTALGVPHGPGVAGSYEAVVEGKPVSDLAVRAPDLPGVDVVPATIDLAGAEIELVGMTARENRLERALSEVVELRTYDYVLVDCPPSLGLLTLNAMVAARELLVPIQAEYYALEGLGQLTRTIDMVCRHLNPRLELSTIVLTMYDARTRLAAQVAAEVRGHFGARVLTTVIPRSVRISEAPSHGQTVLTYDPASSGARAYLDAVRELAGDRADDPVTDRASDPAADAVTDRTDDRVVG